MDKANFDIEHSTLDIFQIQLYQALLLCKKEMIYRDAGVAVRHALSGNTSGGAGTDRGITQWRRDTAH